MGHTIPFPPAPPAFPVRADALDRAECVLLLGIRWWVADRKKGEDPMPRLCEGMERAGAHDAAFSLDRLMEVVARTARRPVSIHCPRCPNLSNDEKHLLYAASLAQSGKSDLVERALRGCLLSAEGAEFALGPLEGLGEFFGAAKLIFRQRRRPPAEPADAAIVEAWSPRRHVDTLH